PVLRTILDNVRKLCDADRATIFRPDAEGVYRPIATNEMAQLPVEAYAKLSPLRHEGGSVLAKAVQERRVIHVADTRSHPDFRRKDVAEAGKFRTLMVVPLLRDEDDIGVLTLVRLGEPRPFDDNQIAWVSTFAAQAVIAMQ